MKKLLREPLLHFFGLGVLLFAVYGWLQGGVFSSPNEIVVSSGQVANLRQQFERVWQRPPSAQELQGLIDNWVREEIFYREGVAMGLDRDDPVVRRRIQQKLEFIMDSASPAAPTDAELQSWLEQHANRYRAEPRYALRQVYFDPQKHGERLDDDLAAARRALEAGHAVAGDPTMLPAEAQGDLHEIARSFGSEFAMALAELPTSSWQGPVASGFGLHLVQLTASEPGRQPTLAEVREAVERDFLHARTEEAKSAYYERLREGYTVRIEAGAIAASGPAG
ncbi:MAG: peptidyl-prolyl cis-trans isomerase [Steroidobacteraceae bacterium]